MAIDAEAARYAAQTFPCYGVQPQQLGWETWFTPWVHDGRVVHWGTPAGDSMAAMHAARAMARVINPVANPAETAPEPRPDTARR